MCAVRAKVKLCARVAVVCMNLCKRKGGREVVEEDKTQKAGELKSEVCRRGLEESECLGKCEIVEAYLQVQDSWTNEGARSRCPEIEKSRRNILACAIP
jgi:hypothetical protein